MTSTDYNQQAQAFLDRFGIKFRCTLSDSKVAPWEDEGNGQRHHFRIVLSKSKQGRITFDFFGDKAAAAQLRTGSGSI